MTTPLSPASCASASVSAASAITPKPVAQPLHRRAGDEDGAFERVGGPAVEAERDGGEQPVARGDRLGAGMGQQEAAGAVGALDVAGLQAALTQRCRVLIAGYS